MVLMVHQHAPQVLQPGAQPFHLPAALVPAEGSVILGFGAFAVRSVRRNELGPQGRQGEVEGVTIVRLIAGSVIQVMVQP
jgi:hypothetical protein